MIICVYSGKYYINIAFQVEEPTVQMHECMYNKHFTLLNAHTRGHPLKFYKQQCRLQLKANFFTLRVINQQNSLPDEIASAPTISIFIR